MDYQIISILYRILLNGNYENLIDLACDGVDQNAVEEFYDKNKKYLFLEDEIDSPVSEDVKENRLRILGLCYYINTYTMPNIINSLSSFEDDLNLVSHKIASLKKSWNDAVVANLNERKDKKYIIKHFNISKQSEIRDINNLYSNEVIRKEVLDELLIKFAAPYLSQISDWQKDDMTLLSEFFYLDDLQKNQIKAVLTLDLLFILLSSDGDNRKALTDYIDRIRKNSVDIHNGGQVPNVLLGPDGIFRAEPFSFDDIALDSPDIVFTETETEITTTYKSINGDYSITIPKTYKNSILGREWDYKKDVMLQGRYELGVLVGILQLGRDQIKYSNKISFTFNNLIKLFGNNFDNNGFVYNRIRDALFYMMIGFNSVKRPNDRVRDFHIINAIDRPENISSGELEWTIELDSALREEILLLNYTELFSHDIMSCKTETSFALYKIFIIDSSTIMNNKNIVNKELIYTLSELTSRTFISGKPSKRKQQIIKALTELKEKENSIIKGFKVLEDGKKFLLMFQ